MSSRLHGVVLVLPRDLEVHREKETFEGLTEGVEQAVVEAREYVVELGR